LFLNLWRSTVIKLINKTVSIHLRQVSIQTWVAKSSYRDFSSDVANRKNGVRHCVVLVREISDKSHVFFTFVMQLLIQTSFKRTPAKYFVPEINRIMFQIDFESLSNYSRIKVSNCKMNRKTSLQSWNFWILTRELSALHFHSHETFRKMEKKNLFLLSMIPQSIRTFPKAPIFVYYVRHSHSLSLSRYIHDTKTRETNRENLFATCCVASSNDLKARRFHHTERKRLSVYFSPRTDEVDRSAVSLHKEDFLLTYFFYNNLQLGWYSFLKFCFCDFYVICFTHIRDF
jgi:hypothetical protein